MQQGLQLPHGHIIDGRLGVGHHDHLAGPSEQLSGQGDHPQHRVRACIGHRCANSAGIKGSRLPHGPAADQAHADTQVGWGACLQAGPMHELEGPICLTVMLTKHVATGLSVSRMPACILHGQGKLDSLMSGLTCIVNEHEGPSEAALEGLLVA